MNAGHGRASRFDGSLRDIAERVIVALSDAVPGRNDGRAFAGASDRAVMTLTTLFRELGLVTRAEVEELELRVSQLEHRLRLLEAESEARPQL